MKSDIFNEDYKLMCDNFSLAYQSLDEEGNFISVNEAWLKLFGYAKEQVIGKWFGDFIHPDLVEHFKTNFPKFKQEGSAKAVFEMCTVNNEMKTINFDGIISYKKDGSFEKTHCILQDISDRIHAHDKLEEVLRFNQEIISSAGEGIIVYDKELRYKVWNPYMERLSGILAQEVLGKKATEKFPRLADIGIIENLKKALKGEPTTELTYPLIVRIADKSGWATDDCGPIFDNNGDIVGVLSLVHDITERKNIQDSLVESERSKALLLANLPGLAYRCMPDKDWTMQFLSDGCYELTGYDPEDLIGSKRLSFNEIIAPEYREFVWLEWKRVIRSKTSFQFEYEIITSAEKRKWVFEVGQAIYDENGIAVSLEGIIIDISERKKVEKILNESEEKYRLLVTQMSQGMALHEVIEDDAGKIIDYRFLEVNRGFEKLTGLKRENILGKTIMEVLPGTEKEWIEKYAQVAMTGESVMFENYARELGKYYEVVAYSPKPRQFATIFNDITDRKQIEEQIKQNNKDLLESQRIAGVGTWRLDLATDQVVWTEELYKMYGFDPAKPVPPVTEHMKLFTSESWDKLSFALEQATTAGIPYELELETVKKDGSNGWMWVRGQAERDIQGNIVFLWGAAQDITEQKQTEINLKESEQQLQRAIDESPIPIMLHAEDGEIIRISKAWTHSTGYTPEDIPTTGVWAEKAYGVNQEEVESVINSLYNLKKSQNDGIFNVSTKNGDTLIWDFYSAYIGTLTDGRRVAMSVAIDVTEQKRLEAEKIEADARRNQQQRLESIGTLASGVAHEINNPINGVINYAQLIVDSTTTDSEQSTYAEEIIRESDRIANIVRDLLHFSRNEKQEHSYANISDIIVRSLSLIQTIIKQDQIEIQINVPEDLPQLKCRNQQIQQVIMNLLTNARDALNEKYPGYHEDKIIKLDCKQFEKESRRWIRVTIEDHGIGIPTEMKEKIFEPFYTSKSRDQGTGLGLSISYGIVKDHHGELTFETKQSVYTKFYLDLPIDNGWDLENKSI